jgi:hypothetical protein
LAGTRYRPWWALLNDGGYKLFVLIYIPTVTDDHDQQHRVFFNDKEQYSIVANPATPFRSLPKWLGKRKSEWIF